MVTGWKWFVIDRLGLQRTLIMKYLFQPDMKTTRKVNSQYVYGG